jgi:hypothetical protein
MMYPLPCPPAGSRLDLTEAPPGAADTATEGLTTGDVTSHG